MLRLPVIRFTSALLAALPLAAHAQTPVDSVVRTTTVTTITTTTVVKPASADSMPAAPSTTSSTTKTTTTAPATTAARQPAPGDLTGARPKATTATPAKPAAVATPKVAAKAAPTPSRVVTTARPATPARSAAPTDPELTRMVQQNVDLSKVRAEELTNLYERFLETTRTERRQWTTAQWESASAALSRLNQRYEQVRADLSLEEKLNIRTLQGEFHTLKAAKQVSKSL
jgi:chemotaxis protein histidine kinase CheA